MNKININKNNHLFDCLTIHTPTASLITGKHVNNSEWWQGHFKISDINSNLTLRTIGLNLFAWYANTITKRKMFPKMDVIWRTVMTTPILTHKLLTAYCFPWPLGRRGVIRKSSTARYQVDRISLSLGGWSVPQTFHSTSWGCRSKVSFVGLLLLKHLSRL